MSEIETPASSDDRPTPKRGRPSSLIPVTRQCEACGQDFDTKVHPVTKRTARGHPARFCSRQCSRKVDNTGRGSTRRAEYEADPFLCPCGKAIEYEHRNIRTYCSPECRQQYAAKRPRDESKWTSTVCETCGEEFDYRTSALPRRFCSNLCAARHTKRVHHHDAPDGAVLDSWWEHLVYSAAKVSGIPIERVDRTEHGVQFDGRFYAPDFWLPHHEVYIEVKGQPNDEQRRKWEAFRQAGHRLLVIDKDGIMDLSPNRLIEMVRATLA